MRLRLSRFIVRMPFERGDQLTRAFIGDATEDLISLAPGFLFSRMSPAQTTIPKGEQSLALYSLFYAICPMPKNKTDLNSMRPQGLR